jgi:two-component system, LuxR family, sensor kinase FixL
LQEKTAELAHISRVNLLGEMTTALAHELNQPMQAIRAYTRAAERLLAASPADLPEAGRAMRAAVLQVDHAAAIVKRLRDFMRKGHIRRSTVELQVITHEAMTFLSREATLAGVTLRVEAPSSLPSIQADRVQLQQVLINLARNALEAIRATGRPGGEIRVSVEANRESRTMQIAVYDTGGGVADEQRERLFEAFATTKPDGVGLGLSISRTIVEAHGGSLWLVATGPAGSEFRFTLPMGSA